MEAYLGIVSRREVRDYLARPLEPEVERRILEAGRLAGSSKNRQPWTFVVVRDDAAVRQVAEAVYERGNILGAAFVVAIVMRGGANIDAGRAAQNMLLAAWAQGVGGSPNGVADHVAMAHVLGTGEDETTAIVLSFGYPARRRDPARRSPEQWIEGAKRKPFDEVVREI